LGLGEIVTIQAFIAPARCRLAVALADHDRFRPGQPNQEFQLAIRLTNAKKATGTTLSKLVSRVQTGGTLNPESREMIMIISPFRAILLIGASFLPGFAAESGRLQAGAAKVDITPAADAALPMSGYADRTEGFKGIHDHIYARAIVLSDGVRVAAIVAWELIGVPNTVWEVLSQRIAREIGIPAEYLLLAAVHDHSAPAPFGMYGNDSPKSASYTKQVEDATVEAIRKAKENLSEPKSGSGPEELT